MVMVPTATMSISVPPANSMPNVSPLTAMAPIEIASRIAENAKR